jgi:hypothetical protein
MPSVASMPESQALKHLHELAVEKTESLKLKLDFFGPIDRDDRI